MGLAHFQLLDLVLLPMEVRDSPQQDGFHHARVHTKQLMKEVSEGGRLTPGEMAASRSHGSALPLPTVYSSVRRGEDQESDVSTIPVSTQFDQDWVRCTSQSHIMVDALIIKEIGSCGRT